MYGLSSSESDVTTLTQKYTIG